MVELTGTPNNGSGVLAPENAVRILNGTRIAALADIDEAPFGWLHFRVSLVAGAGFFTDAYDIFAISIASTMLGYVYGTGCDPNPNNCHLNDNLGLGIKVAMPVGNLFGQLFFGWLADLVGRKRMYGIELMIIIVATLSQATAGYVPGVINMFAVIIFWRFVMGVGVGGDYPLSAVISSEFASASSRGRLMTAVFANQGWGQLTASLVAMCIVRGYKNTLQQDVLSAEALISIDKMWRLLIGLGCVPGAIALYFRLTIPETPRFIMDVMRDVNQAALDIDNLLTLHTYHVDPDAVVQRVRAPLATRSDFVVYFSQWRNLRQLIGASYSWFALDIAFYAIQLNTDILLQKIKFAVLKQTSLYARLYNFCVGNIVFSVGGLIPGYWATFIFIDIWGRRPIQLMVFIMLTILFIVMGSGYKAMNKTARGTNAFMFLTCLTNFFFNFGPNTTTFIVPGEAFPTRYRSTSHGIAAASGKLGAVISQVGFARLANKGGPDGQYAWLPYVLLILAFFMLTGVFSTLLIKETKQRTLEDISNESQEGFVLGLVGRV
ncbi:Repressible high-affinity phosphate permease [Sparassis crispa]|uniref:Repressible high-affinity phosphate permease n=1 Tax=Sparassis crispa TaxID=139825 RepID=A0A401GZ62_9APHY|nr:Repressible high-affinity phosphate permease [Sparassis crispa]GBE87453.1 Repressible high-affinity phosphate permease [Sparassis crispa]